MGKARIENTTTDGELVERAKCGQPEAYAELVRRWSAPVLAICHARVRRRHVAEDLAQETLLRGLRSLASLRSADKFGPWLRGIAQRACLDWLKSGQASQVLFTELADDGHPQTMLATGRDTAAEVERADELRHLVEQVQNLPDDYREVLMLYYYGDFTYRELADLLDVSAATVNKRLTAGRAMLRARLDKSRR